MAQQPDALTAAAQSLGVDRISTLQLIGSGATFTFGQIFTPDDSVA